LTYLYLYGILFSTTRPIAREERKINCAKTRRSITEL